MRKTMIGLGAEDSEDSNMPQNRNSNDGTLSHQSSCKQNNPQQHSNRIVEVLRLELKIVQNKESQRLGAEATCSA